MTMYGVAYYPEHWERKRWDIDLQLMKDSGIKVIRVGEFAWSKMEPEEGEYDFSWLDFIIRKAYGYGIKTILCTPTATPPAWLISKYPEILPLMPDGHTMPFGSRRHYCINNDTYLDYSKKIVEALLKQFSNREEILVWQIDNEFGAEGKCTCNNCQKAFRIWLKDNYGNLDNLNDSWGTIFWGQEYSDWDQIPIVNAQIKYSPNLHLDFRRFYSDSYVNYSNQQVKWIKMFDIGKDITTNAWLFRWGDNINHYDLFQKLDIASFDNYSNLPHEGSFYNVFYKSIKSRYFILEQSTCSMDSQYVVRDMHNKFEFFSEQAIDHGAELICYFRWRQGLFGHEQNHSGILDHSGEISRRYMQLKDITSKKRVDSVLNDKKETFGIYFNYDDCWSLGIQDNIYNYRDDYIMSTYTGHVMNDIYRGIYEAGISAKIFFSPQDIKNVKVLIIPLHIIYEEELAVKVSAFVKEGGTVILTCDLGRKDKNNKFLEHHLPLLYQELLGISIVAHCRIEDSNQLKIMIGQTEANVKSRIDIIKTEAADMISELFLEEWGKVPIITRNRFGEGEAFFVGTYVDASGYRELIKMILEDRMSEVDEKVN